MSGDTLSKSHFEGLNLVKRGKVRDVYEVEDKLLIVATDRMSAFDVVMDDPIPDKGKYSPAFPFFGLTNWSLWLKITSSPRSRPNTRRHANHTRSN